MSRKKAEASAQPQSQAFIDAARELGCDESEAHFEDALKKVARNKPAPEPPQKRPKEGDKSRQR